MANLGPAPPNPLGLSWCDSQWIPILNATNVLDYFSERSNPFYDKTCNNEVIKMQRLHPSHLANMEGIEYMVLHAQEPILYVIRKQHRHANGLVTPMTDYYCIAGTVYQAPDLGSIVNSRLMNTINNLQSAFDECLSYTRYHPSKGYSWEFKDKSALEKSKKKTDKTKEEPSSVFQRQRVDMLLVELSKKFPPRLASAPAIIPNDGPQKTIAQNNTGGSEDIKKGEGKENTGGPQDTNANSMSQQPRMKPPPEKKMRLA